MMGRKPNVEAAHHAGKNGWPAPWIVSSHNYHDEEARAWIAGLKESCPDPHMDALASA